MLTTAGSLGDLYPVLAIARALEAAGLEARLGLSPDDCEVARRWGLLATPVGPSEAEVCERLGVTRDDIAAQVLHDAGPLINQVLIPLLPSMLKALEPLMDGAACMAGTAFAMAGPLAAERARVPWVPLVLQPMLAFSALDPPLARGFGAMARPPRSGAARAWNRAYLGVARGVLKRRHAKPLSQLRRQLGLSPFAGTPVIDPGVEDVPLRLGLWSKDFAPRPEDAPRELDVVGFPPPPDGEMPLEAQRWLDAGPPPLVVTLGSVAQGLGGDRFWAEAVALARRMGLRAVLLHGTAQVPDGVDILTLPYGPHAALFPQAAAVIHHGGIGTSAEALRAARPQLVVPVGGDQRDNAARLAQLGVAETLGIKKFSAEVAAKLLAGLLDRFDYAEAGKLGERIATQDGAKEAALRLATLVVRQEAGRR